jgi:hypothetical protein
LLVFVCGDINTWFDARELGHGLVRKCLGFGGFSRSKIKFMASSTLWIGCSVGEYCSGAVRLRLHEVTVWHRSCWVCDCSMICLTKSLRRFKSTSSKWRQSWSECFWRALNVNSRLCRCCSESETWDFPQIALLRVVMGIWILSVLAIWLRREVSGFWVANIVTEKCRKRMRMGRSRRQMKTITEL